MGIEYYLVKPNKKEIFYLGKHIGCPEGIVDRTYKNEAEYINYDCWEDFFWDFLRESHVCFSDITLEKANEIIYSVYEWCLDDKVIFDNDCREGVDWLDWKETGSLISLFEKANEVQLDSDDENVMEYLKDVEANIFVNPDYNNAIIGVTTDDRVVYDYYSMIDSLSSKDDISWEEAQEFIDYNTVRALPYMDRAPVIVIRKESL